jgi:hypothetical protein
MRLTLLFLALAVLISSADAGQTLFHFKDLNLTAYHAPSDTIVWNSADQTTVYAADNQGNLIDWGVKDSAGRVDTRVLNAAIAATPEFGTTTWGDGTYLMRTTANCTTGDIDYVNWFWTCLPVTKNITIKGVGTNATILKYAPGMYNSTNAGKALIMFEYCPYTESGDGTGTAYQKFTLEDITFDGDVVNQTPYYHDGAGLFLAGSPRTNGTYRNLEFRNSPNHALYLGYNGGGWDSKTVIENINTHDNWGSSQIDNTEDTVIDHWVSENDGYGFWTASHQAIVFDSMYAPSGHLLVDNVHVRDGCINIFGFVKGRDSLEARFSNLYVNSTTVGKHAVYIQDCNNVTISDSTLLAGSANYAASVDDSSEIQLNNLKMRGLRGLVVESGARSDVKLDGCDINTTGDCFRVYWAGSTATLTGCNLYTSSGSAYLINVQAGATATMVGCHGSGSGLVYVSSSAGVLNHAGTSGLGLEAYGATSVTDGGTVSHTMKITPRYVQVTPSVAGTIATVTAIDGTTFTVDFSGTTTTQTVYWHAFY